MISTNSLRWLAAGGLLLVVGGWQLAGWQTWEVRANEYFGDGMMWTVDSGQLTVPHAGSSTVSDGRFAGVIKAWGWYVIYGTAEVCRIIPLWSPVGDAAAVPCGMIFNEKGTVFRGWYEFRGHPRPFCGAFTGKGLPDKCFGE